MRREFKVPVNLVNLSADPASGAEGDIYYNTTSDVVRLYANGVWTTIGAGGGSASDSFTTIAVAGQDNVVADSSTDTLTLVNGTNVSITTNAAADSITINSTGNFTSVDSIVYPDYITFDTTPEASSTETGTMFWDSGDGLPKVILNANVELGLGQEQVALCKNATGSSIPKGSVVYINGAAGQRPTIALADADTEPTSSKTFGLTAETIADGAEGFVVTFGVLRGVNTFGLTEGSALWLSSTAGGYTTTVPAEPSNAVFLGYVVKASTNAGEILINIQNGYELTELHGVLIEPDDDIADNEVLAWDDATGLWKNQTHTEAGLVSGVGTNKISYQTTAPSSPTTGDIWIDSDGDADIQEQTITIPLSDELSVITTGTGVVYWRAPFAMTLTQIPRASLTTASSSGLVTVDVNEGSTSVLGANKLSIDATELTSTTAATATTLADTSIADDAQIRFDIDAAGTNATGLKVTLYYRKT